MPLWIPAQGLHTFVCKKAPERTAGTMHWMNWSPGPWSLLVFQSLWTQPIRWKAAWWPFPGALGGRKATDLGCDCRVSVGWLIYYNISSWSFIQQQSGQLLVSLRNTQALTSTTYSSPLPSSHWVLLILLVMIFCPNLAASFPLSQAMTETSFLFQQLFILIQCFNAILLHHTFVQEEEE